MEPSRTDDRITNQQLQRLRDYFSKAENGESFTLSQAREFNKLAKEFSNEARKYPTVGIGALFLSVLAGFILSTKLSEDKKYKISYYSSVKHATK
jgi:hypothetical protein